MKQLNDIKNSTDMVKERESDSLYLQKMIIQQIEDGELLPGEKIYSERALADKYGMTRMTAQYAINALVRKGYLYRIHGAGTFVRKQIVDKMDLSYMSEAGNGGLTAILKSYGAKLSNKVLTKGMIKSGFFSNKLEMYADKEIYALHRIRFGNDEPLAVEYSYLPAELFNDIEQVEFSRVSLYDYMDSKGHMPKQFSQKLQIVEVGERESKALGINEKEPVYYLEFIGHDERGTVVEYTECYARCDKFEFKFESPPKK
ncbi:MAG: GntR family transcriptional regulator [Parabacteroides sp.]|nr:GntR family transcriptional regulator [Parabacteroides sp.]